MNRKFKVIISLFSIVSMITATFFFTIISGNNPNGFIFYNIEDDDSKKAEASSVNDLPRPAPKKSEYSLLNLEVKDYGNVSVKTKSIDKNFSITNDNKKDIDMSKLKVRYYYTDESNSTQIFRCDGAIVTYLYEPYYENLDNFILGNINKKANEKDKALYYVDVTINKKDGILKNKDKINIFVRISNADKKYYDQSDDYSYYNKSCVVLYYDDQIVSGSELK